MKPHRQSTILEVSDLHKAYGEGAARVAAVRGVSLTIQAGEVLAFLGPNGAGKTTVLKSIAGLVQPDQGQVRVNGYSMRAGNKGHTRRALSSLGAVLEGNRNLYWRLTPYENLMYFGALKGMPHRECRVRAQELLDQFGLFEKTRALVHQLSRGMQQRLAIAVAVVHNPKLLLLDEPTLGLDVAASDDLQLLIRNLARDNHSVLLTTHQLDVAEEVSDRVAIIHEGKLVKEANTQELIRSHSAEGYVIDTVEPMSRELIVQLAALGADADGTRIVLRGEAQQTQDVWKVLALLKSNKLLRVERDKTRLTNVYLDIVGEKVNA